MESAQGNTLVNIGFSLGLQGEFNNARGRLLDAHEINRRWGYFSRMAFALNGLAEVEILAGRYLEAIKYAQQSLNLSLLA